VVEHAPGTGLARERREPGRAECDAVGKLARAARGPADSALERAELLARGVEVARGRVEATRRKRAEQRAAALLGQLGAFGGEIGAPRAGMSS